ncbi:Hypothetical protein SRAE_X000222300 [Strongyloides ratti]|uniref:BZIP domain-containing protein n=1 Tax=Strongyloides ratti TaxID=34506 RepID=A0A090KZ20_STRRB|nr:Hypothetical protein SRAE_X000222200 [Strongyloides ratti]XP_024499693.1 Hypothetical protein SRAE_X000222300 [Strongyloides ratti]CEF60483.1 Hypothetical protein SRAE_X000222200 [Strongyloides ratti]CEF60484.2 Hypothetical protein SRAE_X000222300 [Strongyloides ratti]
MNNFSSFILLTLLILLFCYKSLEISEKNLVDSLNAENVPVPVVLNDEEDKHIIEKRQRSRKQKKKQKRAKRNRRQLLASINAINLQFAALSRQISSLQVQVSNLATTTTTTMAPGRR